MAFSRAECYPCDDRMMGSDLCWCGSADLERFSPAYVRCRNCGTLKVWSTKSAREVAADQEATDFYGAGYYTRQSERYGHPSLEERARADLTERGLHWLRVILKYRHPPAKVLELGSGHGGFVGLLRWTGFDATGLEISPAMVSFAEDEFAAPILIGPLEKQSLLAQSLDLVVLTDVLEHLVDPLATMRKCRTLLRPGGFFVIQTPRVPTGKSYEELVASDDPFHQQLKYEQHLHLFSEQGIVELLTQSGCPHVCFEPAIFAHYDMFLAASPEPLTEQPEWKVASGTPHPPEARLVQALLDIEDSLREDRRHEHSLQQQLAAAEADRAARLEVIESQGAQLGGLRAECNDLRAQLERLGPLRLLQSAASAARGVRNRLPKEVDTRGSAAGAEPRGAEQLAKALATRAADRSLFSLWERHGFHVTPVHFYSAIPNLAELPDSLWQRPSQMVGVDLREEEQLSFLRDTCLPFKSEYDAFARQPTGKSHEYYFNQPMFRSVDAEVLYCMVRAHRPRRLIEVGSGFSTLVSAAALAKNAEAGELIAIEPFPSDILTAGVPGLSELRRERVQDVDPTLFASLRAGDILFIDSSHVLHVGSDVRFLFLEVLPRLHPGVLVHVHDIFLPAEYPREWIIEEHRFWTEQYLLQAFLTFNRGFEVLWAGSFMRLRHADRLREAFASFDDSVWPGSFWLRRLEGSSLPGSIEQCES